MKHDAKTSPNENSSAELARRDFLRKCGKFAVVVPPAMTILLSRNANALSHLPSGGELTTPFPG